MSEQVYGNYESGYQHAVELLATGDPELMADCSGATYDAGKQLFTIRYCNRIYHVSYPDGKITSPTEEVNKADMQILPYYLAQASGLPPRGKWLSFMQLPGGPHHYALFKLEAINPLAERFGNDLASFIKIAEDMGGEPIDTGDVGYVIKALPKIPLGVAVWQGDDEFPATANIVFDASAPTYLSTDTLYLLGIQLSMKLRQRAA
ncbi:MAG: DUF3786 domain-containing protein [Thermoanaerobacteraceae bacterium]|nr:DUF3786 domain-containing protein [Thermoanaerobacteraceae bacterium]